MARTTSVRHALLMAATVFGTGAAGAQEFRRHRHPLPPEIAYRDPSYAPPPRFRAAASPRHPNAPVYNEPPPRFHPF